MNEQESLKTTARLKDLLEQERAGVSRWLEGDIAQMYCSLLDLEKQRLDEIRQYIKNASPF